MLASVRACHQPISKKDMIPTPSQPMKSWKRLLAVTRIIIVVRNVRRYLKNRLVSGSEVMYHMENSIIDQVTNRATGINSIEKKSSLKLRVSSRVWMVIQCQLEIMVSWSDQMYRVVEARLTKKEYRTVVFT